MTSGTTAFEIAIGGTGALLFGVVAAGLLAMAMFGRNVLPAPLVGRPMDNLAYSAYAALLALLYLIVGTNTVTWARPVDGAHDHQNNLLRVVLGMLFNMVWLDTVSRWWFPTGEPRDRVLRPVVAVLVFFGTLSVASSPGAREFALFVVTVAIAATMVVAHVFWTMQRSPTHDFYFNVSLATSVFGGFVFLWLGELLSPSFLGVYGNAIALMMMLLGHACIAPVLYICVVHPPLWKRNADNAGLSGGTNDSGSGDDVEGANLYGYVHNNNNNNNNNNDDDSSLVSAAAATGSTEGQTRRADDDARASNDGTVPLSSMPLTLPNTSSGTDYML